MSDEQLKKVLVRLPQTLHRRIKKQATAAGVPITTHMQSLLALSQQQFAAEAAVS